MVGKTHIADWVLHINAVRAGIECVRNEFLGVKRAGSGGRAGIPVDGSIQQAASSE